MIRRKLLMLVFLAVAVCVMSVGVGVAAVITIDDSGGADFPSIQVAVYAVKRGRYNSMLQAGECPIMWA